MPGPLVAEENGQGADCAVTNVQVGVADAARLDPNEHLPGARIVHDERFWRHCLVGLPGHDPFTLDRHVSLLGARVVREPYARQPVGAD